MQINNTVAEGLKKGFQVTIPSQTINEQVNAWFESKAKKIRLDGFRPGKVPLNILRQRYGGQALQEVVEKITHDTTEKIYKENNWRVAGRPNYEFNEIKENQDFSFSVNFEIFPEIELKDFSKIKLEKLEVTFDDKEIEEALQRLGERHKKFEPAKDSHKIVEGDQVTVNVQATINNNKLESYSSKSVKFVVGEGEDFLVQSFLGHKKGDHITLDHEFPADFSDKKVAGQVVHFEVEILATAQPQKTVIDDAFAKELDYENVSALREKIVANLKADYERLARLYHKRNLLDALAEEYDFAVPTYMVDYEFQTIWRRLQKEIKEAKDQGRIEEEEADKPLDEYEKEYKNIALRRVRLGLVVGEVARQNNIKITPEIVRNIIFQEAMLYPGQEHQVIDFYRNHPEHIEQLTGPALEDLVVDFILEKATLKETALSPQELKKKLKGILPEYDTDEEEEPKKQTKSKKTKKKEEGEAA